MSKRKLWENQKPHRKARSQEHEKAAHLPQPCLNLGVVSAHVQWHHLMLSFLKRVMKSKNLFFFFFFQLQEREESKRKKKSSGSRAHRTEKCESNVSLMRSSSKFQQVGRCFPCFQQTPKRTGQCRECVSQTGRPCRLWIWMWISTWKKSDASNTRECILSSSSYRKTFESAAYMYFKSFQKQELKQNELKVCTFKNLLLFRQSSYVLSYFELTQYF